MIQTNSNNPEHAVAEQIPLLAERTHMYAQLAFEAVTIAGGVDDPLIGTSPSQVPSLARLASAVFFVAVGLSLAGVVFGLSVQGEQSRVRRTESKPRISPNVDGRRIVVASVVSLVISLPELVLLSILTS